MKKMILTGLGSEQKFNSIHEDDGTTRHEKLGSADYYLIFNDGELRVPVSEAAAHVVVQHMYSEDQEPQEAAPPQEDEESSSPPEGEGEGGVDEAGVDQI
jgi:hypothetical protein